MLWFSQDQVRQLGEHDSLHRDMMVGFGKWSWSPLEMENPFAGARDDDEEVKVHLWHGVEDLYVPVQLSRYISKRLPWVIYHELPTATCSRSPTGCRTLSSGRCCSEMSDRYSVLELQLQGACTRPLHQFAARSLV